MSSCSNCGTVLTPAERFCSRCGNPTPDSQIDTLAGTRSKVLSPASNQPVSEALQFAPGTLLSERYRVVAALGRGGMGEVYRADDLKLGHPVALKFLPRAFAEDPKRLEMFHAEVRNSRQVSHPNVCRVYDIGQFQDLTFLTMEYIDGEDLASLLRRIGRLPPDKGLEIAQQLCAGLAAAHDAGLLHRDLKPANVMLDGRGRARITDFGLAVAADDIGGRQLFAGTPAYMAPEQRAGAPASVKTDLYALGLVLFEMFTGKRALEDNNLSAWMRPESHAEGEPKSRTIKERSQTSSSSLSSIALVDPVIRKAILRCLEQDPARRPNSALEVSRALPGGDPLAATLAAGETPAPEMVAAAGEDIAISVRAATLIVVAILLMLILNVPLSRRGTFIGLAPAVKPRELLEDRAQQVMKQAGYSTPVSDSYGFFSTPFSYVQWREQIEPKGWYHTLDSAVPDVYRFTYRTSPEWLFAFNSFNNPSHDDPPMTVPGMTTTVVDGAGRLMEFRAVSPASDKDLAPAVIPDWASMFSAGGWNFSDFRSSEAHSLPNVAFDARAAWDGRPGGTPLHVEAASLRGRPVSFSVSGPWIGVQASSGSSTASQIMLDVLIFIVLPVFGGIRARRNLRLGRGDPVGATRLSIVVVVVIAANTLLAQHWVAHRSILNAVIANAGLALIFAIAVWVAYVAVEPALRRHAPHLLISWARVLSGRFTDGLVGRDMLVGCLAALVMATLHTLMTALPWWFGVSRIRPYPAGAVLSDTPHFLGSLVSQIWVAILVPLSIAFSYAVLRLRIRKPWIASAMLFAIVWPQSFNSEGLFLQLTLGAIGSLLFVFVFVRFGLVTLTTFIFVDNLVFFYPPVLRPNAWYFAKPLIVLLLAVAIVLYSFRCALGGRPLFAGSSEDL
ncbi:MAG TPA: serine/threonine-protein kinase [Terriglobales bacterium]|nr:serine/threonine-protein kinase [Terriglobales bacterium]